MNRLKEARLAAELRQKEVADILHIAQASVSNWESGKAHPSQNNLKALAELYHVSIDYLVGLDQRTTLLNVCPSAEEMDALMRKAAGLPERQREMAESFLRFLIAFHEDGKIRYEELTLLENYIAFLASQA